MCCFGASKEADIRDGEEIREMQMQMQKQIQQLMTQQQQAARLLGRVRSRWTSWTALACRGCSRPR